MGTISRNFLLKMINLHKTKKEIDVVSDQISCPTSTKTLAKACWRIITLKMEKNLNELPFMPILHWCDDGIASWYDISVAIGEISKNYGLINSPAFINPIKSENYPTKAKRPNFSLLDCASSKELLGLKSEYWRNSLENIINSLANK